MNREKLHFRSRFLLPSISQAESEIAITDLCRKDTVTMKRKKKILGLTGLTSIFLASIALLHISVCELDIKLIYAKKSIINPTI